MLSDRILSTIKFFDLQDFPLTAFEVERYLISDKTQLKNRLDDQFELPVEEVGPSSVVHLDTILTQLDAMADEGDLVELNGFYCLPDREKLIALRLRNYRYGLVRERLIGRFARTARHVPFVRGIALLGSQAMGLARPTSDIDLLIITDPNHLWTARTFLTLYFHVFGVRRHGEKIANRFCLNHYLANIREVDVERNLYTAMEYSKARPLVYPAVVRAFQQANAGWINVFFPNVNFEEDLPTGAADYPSDFQRFAEWVLRMFGGGWLERLFGKLQLGRIRQSKFTFVKEDQLSFHPQSKHEALLAGFFRESSV